MESWRWTTYWMRWRTVEMCECEWIVTPAQIRDDDYYTLRDAEDEVWE